MSIVEFDGGERALRGDIRLDGVDVDLVVGDGLVQFDEELTMDGSPIIRLGILDPDRELITSGLLDLDRDDEDQLSREVELVVDEVAYWLRHATTTPGDLSVMTVFEDRTVCKLRDKNGTVKVKGGTVSDRTFIRTLCERAGVPAPITNDPLSREQAARQRAEIGKTKIRVDRDRRLRDQQRRPGVADDVELTVKGARATPEQLQIATRLLSVASEMGAGPKATLALILAGIVESELRNLNHGDRDSVGVLQARPGTAMGARGKIQTVEEARDVEYMAESFLIDKKGYGFTGSGGAMYLERTTSMTAAQIAQAVEGSAFPDRYAQYEAEGRAIVAAFGGGGLSSGLSGSIETRRDAALRVERGESFWDAARRTAEDRNARFFVVANQPYYLYDEALMASRPVATIADPAHPRAQARRIVGVEGIGWEWAPRKQLRQCTLVVNARARQLPPGSVLLLDQTCGPAGFTDEDANRGRWLVYDFKRSRFQDQATLTLVKGRKPRVPTETDSESWNLPGQREGAVDPADLRGVDRRVAAMYAKADEIARARHPYTFGGGHGSFSGPYDCSGLVSAVLHAGGLLDTPMATGGLIGWGEAGRGRAFTVWVKDGPQHPGGGHTFIEFHTTGGSRFIEANGPTGTIAGWRTGNDTSSYTARHWRGL